MKRSVIAGEESISTATLKKKTKVEGDLGGVVADAVMTDENLLYEVFKHVDGRTLAAAACVNRQWNKTAQEQGLARWQLSRYPNWSFHGQRTVGYWFHWETYVSGIWFWNHLNHPIPSCPKPN